MTFDEKAGVTDHLSRPTHKNWDMWIESLGGLDAFDRFLPYSLPELCRMYQADKHFNTSPVRFWDRAAGYTDRPKNSRDAMISKGPFRDFLVRSGVTSFNNSQCVGLLKRCAERRVLEAMAYAIPDEIYIILECKAEVPDRFNNDNVYDYTVARACLRKDDAEKYERKDPERRLMRVVDMRSVKAADRPVPGKKAENRRKEDEHDEA